eukprot:XP_011606027.1 PREDICTED: eukaryotic translation initiation factor 4 gamma 2-like [Takifugu rubripes]
MDALLYTFGNDRAEVGRVLTVRCGGSGTTVPPTPSYYSDSFSILHCQAAKVESVIAEGGASRFSASSGGGGGRGAPQHYPKTVGNSEFLGKTPGQSVQRWVPSRSTRRDVNSSTEKERHDAIFRKVRGTGTRPLWAHRTNPLFNGHGGHIAPPPPSQFDMGPKSFVKSNQVQNQHFLNQNQNHMAQQQVQTKDMPPRFSKKGQINADEISLRPAQSFLLNKNQVPKLQPQIPTMMPPSAQPPRTQTPPLGQPPQLGLKTNPPPIQEKPQKTNKKPPPAREELLKMTEAITAEYLSSKNLTGAVTGVRDMRAPKHFLPEMLSKIIICSLDRPDEDKEHVSTLIHTLRAESLITGENFMQAFLNVLDQCPKIEQDVPLVKSYLAQFVARAVIAELVSVAELAHPLENGTHFPLFLLCLQQTAKLKDREWITDLFQQSKVNMQKMLPEIDQNKDRMLEILEGKGLSFLFPLLKLEKELLKQIKADPSPQSIYKWIKDNISPKLHTDKGFVNILMTSFLQYISQELCMADNDEQLAAPSKEQQEQEKQLLLAFKPVMQKFLHDHTELQVSALYALQVHCNANAFPKGMLLRYFVNFYDMEIIEEEAFLAWKEDITQEFPGKGKALFQVNQWLTWLETAEEEESDDEAD